MRQQTVIKSNSLSQLCHGCPGNDYVTSSRTSHSSSSSTTMIEAAIFHRDGEQARIINLVSQPWQHDYETMFALTWI
eukprot:scaffold5215_cov51-Cyclotella_meneghiniana.AAC.4